MPKPEPWFSREEGQRTAIDTHIQLELKRARLYLAAGYREESLEAFQDARDVALDYRLDDLHDGINDEIARLWAHDPMVVDKLKPARSLLIKGK